MLLKKAALTMALGLLFASQLASQPKQVSMDFAPSTFLTGMASSPTETYSGLGASLARKLHVQAVAATLAGMKSSTGQAETDTVKSLVAASRTEGSLQATAAALSAKAAAGTATLPELLFLLAASEYVPIQAGIDMAAAISRAAKTADLEAAAARFLVSLLSDGYALRMDYKFKKLEEYGIKSIPQFRERWTDVQKYLQDGPDARAWIEKLAAAGDYEWALKLLNHAEKIALVDGAYVKKMRAGLEAKLAKITAGTINKIEGGNPPAVPVPAAVPITAAVPVPAATSVPQSTPVPEPVAIKENPAMKLSSVPSNAIVYIDNKSIYKRTDLETRDYPPGEYAIRLEMAKHKPVEERIVLTEAGFSKTWMLEPDIQPITRKTIVIDGKGEDWEGVPYFVQDIAGDDRIPAIKGTDIVSARICADDKYAYVRIDFADGKPVPAADKRLYSVEIIPDAPWVTGIRWASFQVYFTQDNIDSGELAALGVNDLSATGPKTAYYSASGCSVRFGTDFYEARYPISGYAKLMPAADYRMHFEVRLINGQEDATKDITPANFAVLPR